MKSFKALTAVEQLVEYLREEIVSGELSGNMPGVRKLARSIGASSNTVVAAVAELKRGGFIEPQGHGRRSRIVIPDTCVKPGFRVTLLLYERADVQLDYAVEIQRRLKENGYHVRVADKSLMELGVNVNRIARMVEKMQSDAWVVFSCPEKILEWFVSRSIPTFALFGRFRRLPIAAIGLDKSPAFRAAVRRLAELGHQRIVLLQPRHNLEPVPSRLIRESLEEMQAHGIKTGAYNIPTWEQSPRGLRRCLDSLFAVTPPTAIIFDRANELIGAQLYLARKGILAPQHISLVSDDDPAFEWCEPSISSIQWHSHPWVNRVARWVGNIASGKEDLRQSFSKAKFVERGSIGPVPCFASAHLPSTSATPKTSIGSPGRCESRD
jgi:DNA-binding LacI/PurR family transcriptional regulator